MGSIPVPGGAAAEEGATQDQARDTIRCDADEWDSGFYTLFEKRNRLSPQPRREMEALQLAGSIGISLS